MQADNNNVLVQFFNNNKKVKTQTVGTDIIQNKTESFTAVTLQNNKKDKITKITGFLMH